jgi:hypothetical protein
VNRFSSKADRATSWLMALAVFLCLGIAIAYAFYTVFSRPISLDEGYLMITVRGFLDGHALYDVLFTQYGPFYYAYEWILRALFHVPLTHDATRWLCMFHWIAAAIVLGLAGWQMTKSMLVGALVFMQSLVHLRFLANEPGHPQEIVVLLVAVGALIAARGECISSICGMLALVAAALTFTKINVGVFFIVALLFTIHLHTAGRLARALAWLLPPFCAVIPFLLMRHHLGQVWCRIFSTITACTLLATCFVAMGMSVKDDTRIKLYFRMALFFLIPSMCFVGVAALTGTSARGFIEGLILIPLKMPSLVALPIMLPGLFAFSALVAVIVALLVLFERINARLLALLKLCYGLIGMILFIGEPVAQAAALLPWAWLVLVPNPPARSRTSEETFPRVFLCFAAALQTLQAYPVAGTQVANGTFLLVLVYVLCVADCLPGIEIPGHIKTMFLRLSTPQLRSAQATGVAMLLFVFTAVWCQLPAARNAYTSLSALALPGSTWVRMASQPRKEYRDLASYLKSESDTFITYPCINSLYFWAHKEPPTQLNGTIWLQFTPTQQNYILASLRRFSRPKIVVPTEITLYWGNQPVQIEPLIHFLSHDCVEERRIGRFSVLVPKPEG